MSDLLDGQTAEVWGSGAKPYQLKNVGGVYSCSCPAWRNQSLPIDQRTCKHLRQHRGEAAEMARLGSTVVTTPATKNVVSAPPLLLAESWNPETDPRGWWLSEKLDGVRAFWTGREFLSRNGNLYAAPEWFKLGLPSTPLDGELWIGRKQFQRTVSIVRRGDGADLWREVRYLVFDAPAVSQPFEQRLAAVKQVLAAGQPPYALPLHQEVCRSREHLETALGRVEQLGGEGLMLRRPASLYEPRRSSSLQKVKRFLDCEGVVIGHEPGKGRHKGRLGALLVQLPNGIRFACGTGLSDAQRELPPAIGDTVTVKYQELTDGGVPRFPVYAGVRRDEPANQQIINTQSSRKGHANMPTAITPRRFEFVGGNSSKFWEVRVQGSDVYTSYGRIGSSGQASHKTMESAEAATAHVEKLVREKTAKGYAAVA
ncbi:MAG: DNA ligase [Planctomycetales bacterium]|nr:DNA ligase [Planctomycetales bacterium]